MITGVPSTAVSCCWAICGDDTFISPSFLAITANDSSVAGNACWKSTAPSDNGRSIPIWTVVFPDGNGPPTRMWLPVLVASGDEPWRIVVLTAALGTSHTNGAVVFTGARAVI